MRRRRGGAHMQRSLWGVLDWILRRFFPFYSSQDIWIGGSHFRIDIAYVWSRRRKSKIFMWSFFAKISYTTYLSMYEWDCAMLRIVCWTIDRLSEIYKVVFQFEFIDLTHSSVQELMWDHSDSENNGLKELRNWELISIKE